MSKVLGYRRPYFDTQPAHLYPGYRSTIKRAPSKPLVHLPHTISEVTGPLFGSADLGPNGPWGRYNAIGVRKSFGTRRW